MTMTTPSTSRQEKQPRQGRTNLKPELMEAPIPLPKIAMGEDILIELNRHRYLTNQQVANLLFRGRINQLKRPYSVAGAKDAADRSLKRLWEQGYIERQMVYQLTDVYSKPLKPGEPRPKPATIRATINTLSREGASLVPALLENRDLDDDLRWSSRFRQLANRDMAHELEINDAIIALRRAVGAVAGASILFWRDDAQLSRLTKQGKAALGRLTPDGFCLVLCETDNGSWITPLFFEIDRQTTNIRSHQRTGRDWRSKIERYGAYLARLFPTDPLLAEARLTDWERQILANPRVLTITTTHGRVEKMLDVTHEVGGRGTYLYATKDDVYGVWGNILGSAWRSTLHHPGERVSLLDLLQGR